LGPARRRIHGEVARQRVDLGVARTGGELRAEAGQERARRACAVAGRIERIAAEGPDQFDE